MGALFMNMRPFFPATEVMSLFFPVLPPAYHRIVHLITDRLNTVVEGKASTEEWISHGWVLMWIVFVGATVHNGDLATRRSLIQNAAPLCVHLFSRSRQTSDR